MAVAGTDQLGYAASGWLVGTLLHGMVYGLHGNRKTVEGIQISGPQSAVRANQCRVTKEMRPAQPVISVDTKNNDLVGDYPTNQGKWCFKKGGAQNVNGHDFPGDPSVP
jgi:hypothetical protein